MGHWSYVTVEGERVIFGEEKRVYMLIPKEFGGGSYYTDCFSGMGNSIGPGIFEFLADTNKEYLSSDNLEAPVLEQFGGLWSWDIEELKAKGLSEKEIEAKNKEEQKRYYDMAVARYELSVARINDFKVLSHEQMLDKYGVDYKYDIGNDISRGEDELMAKLKYPLKLSRTDMKYEDTPYFSIDDEGQGSCFSYDWETEEEAWDDERRENQYKEWKENIKNNYFERIEPLMKLREKE
ncbi:MAG: hypothetical protein E7273_13105 [Pseudobutyrivibrio ruminis]|nr:hypothetical protein [Pseudobutyrivibrio ruminis]